jgi:hypothetical protein
MTHPTQDQIARASASDVPVAVIMSEDTRARDIARMREEYPDATDDEIAYYLDTAEQSIG